MIPLMVHYRPQRVVQEVLCSLVGCREGVGDKQEVGGGLAPLEQEFVPETKVNND